MVAVAADRRTVAPAEPEALAGFLALAAEAALLERRQAALAEQAAVEK